MVTAPQTPSYYYVLFMNELLAFASWTLYCFRLAWLWPAGKNSAPPLGLKFFKGIATQLMSLTSFNQFSLSIRQTQRCHYVSSYRCTVCAQEQHAGQMFFQKCKQWGKPFFIYLVYECTHHGRKKGISIPYMDWRFPKYYVLITSDRNYKIYKMNIVASVEKLRIESW